MISLAIPAPSVAGVPRVVDCIGGPVLPATEHPHPAVVDHAGKIVARPPVSLRRHWGPVATVRTAPDVSRALATEEIQLLVEDHYSGLVAGGPRGGGGHQGPVNAVLGHPHVLQKTISRAVVSNVIGASE